MSGEKAIEKVCKVLAVACGFCGFKVEISRRFELTINLMAVSLMSKSNFNEKLKRSQQPEYSRIALSAVAND
jgi:hypothetical protein